MCRGETAVFFPSDRLLMKGGDAGEKETYHGEEFRCLLRTSRPEGDVKCEDDRFQIDSLYT